MKKFEILLDKDWFKKKDVLESHEGIRLKILDIPKKHYAKWYWRILNFLTFKLFFNVTYTYTVKQLEDESDT